MSVSSPAPARQAVPSAGEAGYRPPYLAAAIAALAIWILYFLTLSPSTAFWDTSEYIATAHIMGIPHPPGSPTFVVVGRAWDVLLSWTGLSAAQRLNVFAATMSALAHGCWFLVVDRILFRFTPDRRFRLVGAAIAVLISATAFTVWNQSDANAKVYMPALFTIALVSWLAFRWRDNLGRPRNDNLIVLMVFIVAFSVGNHLMAFLVAPAAVLFFLLVAPRRFTNWKLYVASLVAAVLGLSIQLFLPLRASLHPLINEADPQTWHAILDSLLRKQYDKPSIFVTKFDPQQPRTISLILNQIGNYLQYFDWQWARSVAGNVSMFGGARPLFTAVFSALGLYGAWKHFLHDRISWAFMAVLFLTVSLGLVGYMNFAYGYTWRLNAFPNMAMHEVRERDYFFIVSFSMWGLWAGMGLASLWKQLADDLAERIGAMGRALATTSPILVIALIPLVLNWSWASRKNDYTAPDWAYNMLESVPPYGVLFTNGDNDTFPLWFAQEVDGVRQDVTVIVTSYLNTAWYARQLRDLTRPCPPGVSALDHPTRIVCQRDYVVKGNPGFYASMTEKPTRSILPLTDAQIATIAKRYPFRTPSALDFSPGNIRATIPKGSVMAPYDIFMSAILTNSMGDRPICFASTTRAYDDLGLSPFLIRQGLALVLHNGPVHADSLPGVYEVPGRSLQRAMGRYLNLPRTHTLLWDVFRHRSPGIPAGWTHWVDKATEDIPIQYAYTYYVAGRVDLMAGDSTQAARNLELYQAWGKLATR